MMATCKDCVHHDWCFTVRPDGFDFLAFCGQCGGFKDKSECVEQKHGQWKVVDSDGSWRVDICSLCGKRMHYVDYALPDNYCPNCGAKMDGGDENE